MNEVKEFWDEIQSATERPENIEEREFTESMKPDSGNAVPDTSNEVDLRETIKKMLSPMFPETQTDQIKEIQKTLRSINERLTRLEIQQASRQ